MLTTSLTGFLRLALWIGLGVASWSLGAQGQVAAATQPLRFEIASIRLHGPAGDEPSDRRVLPGGRFVAKVTTVRTLLRVAFLTDDSRMSGAPSWVDDETFDISATTADRAEITTPEQFQQVILSLLEERFQLKFHREHAEGAVYWLEVNKPGKLGPALKPSSGDAQPNMSVSRTGALASMKVSRMSMGDVASALRRQAGRPVEDHTDLTGKFDFQIQWAPDQTADSVEPSLFTVLKEQLGLKLQPAKGSLETLVIDQIQKPSEN